MKNKKLIIVAVLLVAILAMSLVACTNDPPAKNEDPTTYKVTYRGGEGATGTAPTESAKEEGERFTLQQNTFSKEGYSFSGWSDGDDTYSAGTSYTMGNANVVFTAQWTKDPVIANAITITGAEGGTGSLADPYTVSAERGDIVILTTKVLPEDAEYTDISWTIGIFDGDEFVKDSNESISLSESGANLMITVASKITVQELAVKGKVQEGEVYVKITIDPATINTEWEGKAELLSDWTIEDGAIDDVEGGKFELNRGKELSNVINVTNETSGLRLVLGKGDGASSIKVKVDGTLVKSMVGGIPIDGNKLIPMLYDLSQFVGQQVELVLENNGDNSLIIESVNLYSIDNTPATATAWKTKEAVENGWNKEAAQEYRSGTGEGFDLNTNDTYGVQYIHKTISVTNETSRLNIKVRRFNQDNNVTAQAMLVINGSALTAINGVGPIFYVRDLDGMSSNIVYDLSAFIGQTVSVAFGLVNPGVGHLVIQEIVLDAYDSTPSTKSSWNFNNTSTDWEDWDHTFNNQENPYNEGYNLNTEGGGIARAESFIYNHVTVPTDNTVFVVNVRRFTNDGNRIAKVALYVNNTLVSPFGYDQLAEIPNADGPITRLAYDLSQFAGQTVRIMIASVEPGQSRLVVMNAGWGSLPGKVPTSTTSWDKTGIQNEWNITFAPHYKEGVGEGFDLYSGQTGESEDANPFIFNTINVTANSCIVTVNVRRFGQDEGRVAALGFVVNGEVLTPASWTIGGQEVADVNANLYLGYVPVEDTDGIVTTVTYDLSAYIGKQVVIGLINPATGSGHLVVMNVAISAPVVA